jgi:hypothetical protein
MCEGVIKTARLFEDIFREMEASIRNLEFFKDNEVFGRKFQFKEFEAFLNYFQINFH